MARLLMLLVLAVGLANAAYYDLYTLVNSATPGGNQLVIGDKTFTFEAAVLSGTGAIAPQPPLAAGMFSITPTILGNLYGFTILGGMSATGQVNGTQVSLIDLALIYTVTTAEPRMTDIHAAVNGGCSLLRGNGTCDILVTETAQDATGASVISPNVLQASPGSGPQEAFFNPSPLSFVRITKDINLTVTATGTDAYAFGSISVVDQFISQVPEPGFYGALAFGLSGIFLAVQRRRRSS